MEKHNAIIICRYKEIHFQRTSGYGQHFTGEPYYMLLDESTPIKVTIDRPILEEGESIYISELNKIGIVHKVIKTDIENTIMYQVDGLKEDIHSKSYAKELKEKEKYKDNLEEFNSKMNISEVSCWMVEELYDLKMTMLNNEYKAISDSVYEYLRSTPNILNNLINKKLYVGHTLFKGISYSTLRDRKDHRYYITSNNEYEELLEGNKILKVELSNVKFKLDEIKSKGWFKLFYKEGDI